MGRSAIACELHPRGRTLNRRVEFRIEETTNDSSPLPEAARRRLF